MRKSGKRMLSLLVCLVLLLTMLPRLRLPAAAADVAGASSEGSLEGYCGNYARWKLDDAGTLSISGSGSMEDYSSASNVPWYIARSLIKKVTVNGSVNRIGDKAFCYCTNLTSVTISNNVTTIGDCAFYGCTGLTSVTIPGSVTNLENNVFYGCRNLTSITMRGSAPSFSNACLGNITATVYYPCSDKTWTDSVGQQYGGNITWVASHTYDENGICLFCRNGQTVEVLGTGTCGTDARWQLDTSGTLTIGGTGPMEDYYPDNNDVPWQDLKDHIRTVVIGEGITKIGNYTFDNCLRLSRVTLPEGVTILGDTAFFNCASLKDITIPASVTQVNASALRSCDNLTSITFLGSAPSLQWQCLDDTYATVYYPCDDETWTEEAKNINNRNITWIGHIYTDYEIRQEATCTSNAMARGTCGTCGATATVAVPGTVLDHIYDENGMCLTCTDSLNQLVIRMTNTGKWDAFGGWDGAYIQIFADGVFIVNAFLDDFVESGGKVIPYIPCKTYTFKWVSGDSDSDCHFSINLGDKELISRTGSSLTDGKVFYTLKNSLGHYYKALCSDPTCTTVGITGNICRYCGKTDVIRTSPATGHSYAETVIPPTCTTAGSVTYTCTTCEDVYNALTPATGHSFVRGVCAVCQSTQDIEILHSGTCGTNLQWQFDSTGTLTVSGTGPMDSYTYTSAPWSKAGCIQQITNVVIEEGVTSVGYGAFKHCFSLERATLPESLTTINGYGFYYCHKMVLTNIPKGLKSIGLYAFYACDKLTSFTVPENVKKISSSTFKDSDALISVTIPANVTSIEAEAFQSCDRLNCITFLGSAPTIAAWSFRDVTALAYYPCHDTTWTDTVKAHYGGTITWIPKHSPDQTGKCTNCGKASDLIIRMDVTPINSRNTDAIKVYEDGVLLTTATIPSGFPYLTPVPYQHGKTYTFQWVSGSGEGQRSFEIMAGGRVLASGQGSDYSDGQIIYTLENAPDHQYETVVTPPTCTREGFTTSTCIYCGFIKVTDTVPATGHSNEEVVTPPTCTEGGTTVINCATCGYNAVINTPATGHHYDATGQCVDCDIQFELVVYMTDTYGDGWNGSAVEVYVDDDLLTTVSLSKGLLNGDEEITYVPGKTYQLKWKSSDYDNECGFKITLNGEMLASGQGSGYTDGQILCIVGPACAHVYQTTVTPPTCTDEGYTTGTCTVCGYSSIINTTPATGHNYVDGVCSVCQEEEGLAGGNCGDDLQWKLYEDGRLTITGTGPMYNYNMPEGSSVPDTPWCEHRQLITKVVIETGATTIGEYAFHGCTGLTDVTIPESITDIGKLAFYNCTGLRSMTIPEGVVTIGSAAFRRCSSLTGITLPEGVTTIGKIAFYDCTALTDITLPESVTGIGEYAFGNCTNLATITFSGSAPSMDSNCFRNVTATAIHPCNDQTWTNTVKQSYGGVVTWEANHSFGDYIPDGNATCTADGTTTRTCSTCAATETKPLPGTATGHRETTIPGQAATCTETGLTEGVTCDRCNEILTAQQTIPATGHSEKTVPGYAPTCTETGLTDGVQCAICNEVLTPQQTIPTLDHDYLVTNIPVTCTGYGYDLHQCQRCGNNVYHNVISPTGHSYENGICTVCGDVTITSLPGDVNGDGQLSIADVAKLYAHIKGTVLLDSLACADVNGDGNVNIADTARLYAHVQGTNPLS